jgi:16S rRNA (uracil1498-N3)-methyltransferase
MARRLFYVQDLIGGEARLQGETATHIRKVLRGERGQRYEVSDGEQLWLAEIRDFGKDSVVFQLVERLEAVQPPVRIKLYPALIKFDAFEWILEKATELGVETITPVYSLRSDKGLDQAAKKRRERWLRILAESGQQCRRLAPPQLEEVIPLRAALETTAAHKLWLEEQRGAENIISCLPATRQPQDEISVLCGPEGGWDDRERKEAEATGWKPVSLGNQILRAETAALAALAVLTAAWGQAGD